MKISISKRLIAMLAGAVAALAVLGLIAYLSNQSALQNLKLMQEGVLEETRLVSKIESHYALMRLNALYHLLYTDAAKKAPHDEAIKHNENKIKEVFEELGRVLIEEDEIAQMKKLRQQFDAYSEVLTRIIDRSRANEIEAAMSIVEKEGKPLGFQLTQAFQKQSELNAHQAARIAAQSVDDAESYTLWSVLTVLGGIVMVTASGYMLRRGILRSLKSLQHAMTEVGMRLDFSQRAQVCGEDEIATTARAFNHLVQNVNNSLQSVSSGATQLADSAAQMSQASNQVAESSASQSDVTSGMAAAVEEMLTSISQIGEHAAETLRLSQQAGELSGSGARAIILTVQDIDATALTVEHAGQLISTLEKQSKDISTIVAVIKDVAEQTNLLALNAAIEAARAGEQGRGFSVVADEVRKLAERTASSAKEITTTIDLMNTGATDAVRSMHQVIGQVAQSADKVRSASLTMAQIEDSSRRSAAMVGEIVSALREQTHASHTVAGQIEKISQMAEESANAATHSARTADELDQLAASMNTLVAAYRL